MANNGTNNYSDNEGNGEGGNNTLMWVVTIVLSVLAIWGIWVFSGWLLDLDSQPKQPPGSTPISTPNNSPRPYGTSERLR